MVDMKALWIVNGMETNLPSIPWIRIEASKRMHKFIVQFMTPQCVQRQISQQPIEDEIFFICCHWSSHGMHSIVPLPGKADSFHALRKKETFVRLFSPLSSGLIFWNRRKGEGLQNVGGSWESNDKLRFLRIYMLPNFDSITAYKLFSNRFEIKFSS